MKIQEHNLDSLRKLIRNLQTENRSLKEQLKKAGIPFEKQDAFEEKIDDNEEYDLDQGERISSQYITKEMARAFFGMFWGRHDVFAKRGSKGGYFPQCNNRWNNNVCPKQHGEKTICDSCEFRDWTPLDVDRLIAHFLGYREDGADAIGIYPLLPDGTCRFIVFDFDNHEKGAEQNDFANKDDAWRDEVDALRSICEENGITPLVERSRSGIGAHVWIFFRKPIPASMARNFGFLLLDKGSASINLKSFQYYDRMYPSQDAAKSLGNLIALPLQGRPLREGNTAFVDKNWNAYPNQWDVLLNHTPKLSREEIEDCMVNWQAELAGVRGTETINFSAERPKPWKKEISFSKEDVIGKLHIVLADGVYVDALNLMPRIQNQIRSMAAFDNPVYYKNKRLGYSNYYNFSTVYMGSDVDGYIKIPRGLKERLIATCETSAIPFDVSDQREKGRPIRVQFKGDLRVQQDVAANRLLSYDNGILSAATAFGKTVVCSYLIAERKVSTLILVQSKDLLEQWVDSLNKFLDIDEELPKYKTKTGREKTRDSVIGILHGSKNSMTGIIDVAMIGSLYSKGRFNEYINSYGMVIMDECHHAASATAVEVLQKINARYVYGVSATPQRSDNLEKIIFMLLGDVRHKFTARERAIEQGIGHYVYPRYTNVVDVGDSRRNINKAYELIKSNELRNGLLIDDIKGCVTEKRTPVVLTKYKEHAKLLYDNLQNAADCVYLLYGDNTDKENSEIKKRLHSTPGNKSLILIATGQKIGEGFDYPRLDTLMLAAPVATPGILEQYVGRLNRDYEGKDDVIVYDYVDSHVRYFDNMYSKRLKTYRKIGFQVVSDNAKPKQAANAIYDSDNYADVFERDIVEANRRIIVASPEITREKVDRFISLAKSRQLAGVEVTVITTECGNKLFDSPDFHMELIEELKKCGMEVICSDEMQEHFAVIDEELVWHGGMNLLGKADIWDNLMRIKSARVAAELMEMALVD